MEPLALSTPELLAGPGVSSPTATISESGNAGVGGRDAETVFDLLEADIRPLFRKGGVFAQALDEELFFPVD